MAQAIAAKIDAREAGLAKLPETARAEETAWARALFGLEQRPASFP